MKTNFCPFNKNNSLNQKPEQFDLLRLVLYAKFQVFRSKFLGEETNLRMRLKILKILSGDYEP